MGYLRFLMCALIFSIVNALHLPSGLARGLNIQNVLTILILLQLARLGSTSPRPAPLKVGVTLLSIALVYGFLIGVARDSTQWVTDLTTLKNALFYPLLFFVFYHGIRDYRTAEVVIAALLGTAALAGVEAIREGFDYGIDMYSDTKRASGPFGTDYRAANLAAVFFCMFFPMFVAIGMFARTRPFVRLLAFGGAALIVFGTFFTYSRQAYAILAITIALIAARRNLLLVIPAILALVAYDQWAPDAVVERIAMTDQSDEFGSQQFDASTESRFELWDAAWSMFLDHPSGVGLGHFKAHIGEYAPKYAGMDAHNFYVLFLAETGVVGVLLLAGALTALVSFAWKTWRRARSIEAKALAIGFQLTVFALLAGNLYGSRLLDGAVTGNIWILAAAVLRFGMLSDQLEEEKAQQARLPAVASPGSAHTLGGAGARMSGRDAAAGRPR